MLSISEDLKKVRVLNNITQGQMADFMGVSQSYISRIEHGKENPSKTFLRLFSLKYLNDDYENNIGFRIKSIREKNRLNTDDFALKLGISVDELDKFEDNSIVPSDTVIKLIAVLFKSDEYWIKTGDL